MRYNEEQKQFLIKLIKSGKKTRNETANEFNNKFKKNISFKAVKEFAQRQRLRFKEKNIDAWSLKEEQIFIGLWLIDASTKRKLIELPSRSKKSMRRKKENLIISGKISDKIKNEIKEKLTSGTSTSSLAKTYGIEKKYVDEFFKLLNKEMVEFTNLKRWEEKDVDDILDLMEQAQEKIRNLETEQKEANININTKANYIALAFCSDFHLENVNTDLKQLRNDFKIIKETPNFYMGFGGDILDGFLIGPHPNGAREAVVSIKTARMAAGKLFDTIKGKVLWTILGCHDNWEKDAAQYDTCEHIARKLRIPYLGHGGDINLKVNGGVEYFIHARHKYPGGGKLNGTGCCKNILRDVNPKYDLVCVSHNHIAEIKIEDFLGKQRVYVRSGSYKKSDEYSKMLGYVENEFNQQIPVALLNTKTKEMKVVSGISNASSLLKALNK